MSDQPQVNIIIKKVKKVQGGGHHGGAWKVAFADFMTAMMAFFMVMWLVSMLPPESKKELAMFFKKAKYYPITQKGETPASEGGYRATKQKKPMDFSKTNTNVQPVNIKSMIQKRIDIRLKDLADYVAVSITEEGVRIDIIDHEGNLMFPPGSPELKPQSMRIIGEISKVIAELDNNIAIEGHTDATAFSSAKYSNWELSTDRASVARKAFESYGIDPARFSMVAGYAATKPLIPEDPYDARNRRIGITILMPQANKTIISPVSKEIMESSKKEATVDPVLSQQENKDIAGQELPLQTVAPDQGK